MSWSLPGGVYLRQHGNIRQLQLPDKVLKQRLCAGVGMGLEGADDPLIGHGAGGGQQCVKLSGMMCVVIEHIGAVIVPLNLKSAPGAVEAMKALLYSLAANAQHIGGSGGSQSVGCCAYRATARATWA